MILKTLPRASRRPCTMCIAPCSPLPKREKQSQTQTPKTTPVGLLSLPPLPPVGCFTAEIVSHSSASCVLLNEHVWQVEWALPEFPTESYTTRMGVSYTSWEQNRENRDREGIRMGFQSSRKPVVARKAFLLQMHLMPHNSPSCLREPEHFPFVFGLVKALHYHWLLLGSVSHINGL